MSEQSPVLVPEATDAELLARFLDGGEQAAFAQIVDRHARLVLFACRAVLRREQDVEDAFQATFLLVVRKAHGLRRRDSLAAWLFRVARRVSLRAARKRETPADLVDVATTDADLANVQARDEAALLSRELERLPETYRLPIVLHHLGGMTRAATAEQLECTEASVNARLVRGRRMLRRRLMRRGVGLSVVLAAAATGSLAVAAQSPLVSTTTTAVSQLQLTGQCGSACTAGSASLVEGVSAVALPSLKASLVTGSSVAATLLVAVGVAVSQTPEPMEVRDPFGSVPATADGAVVDAAPAVGVDAAVVSDEPIEVRDSFGSVPATADGAVVDAAPVVGGAAAVVSDDPMGSDGGESRDGASYYDGSEPDVRPTLGPGLKSAPGRRLPTPGQPEERKVNSFRPNVLTPTPSKRNRRVAEALPRFETRTTRATEERIYEAFGEATEMQFVNTPLKEVIEFTADLHGIPMWIDVSAIEQDAGIPLDEPISLQATGVSLESALNLVLKPRDLNYYVDDEVLKITTREKAEQHRETRLYKVDWLKVTTTSVAEFEKLLQVDEGASVVLVQETVVVTQSPIGHRRAREVLELLEKAQATASRGTANGASPSGRLRDPMPSSTYERSSTDRWNPYVVGPFGGVR